eukprot:Rmarinus@m.14511
MGRTDFMKNMFFKKNSKAYAAPKPLITETSEDVLTYFANTVWEVTTHTRVFEEFKDYDTLRRWFNRVLICTNVETLLSAMVIANRFRTAFGRLTKEQQLAFRTPITSVPRLYFIACLVAHKNLYDVPYTNRVWIEISEDLYSLMEINAMELDLLKMVNWQVHVSHTDYEDFVGKATEEFFRNNNLDMWEEEEDNVDWLVDECVSQHLEKSVLV